MLPSCCLCTAPPLLGLQCCVTKPCTLIKVTWSAVRSPLGSWAATVKLVTNKQSHQQTKERHTPISGTYCRHSAFGCTLQHHFKPHSCIEVSKSCPCTIYEGVWRNGRRHPLSPNPTLDDECSPLRPGRFSLWKEPNVSIAWETVGSRVGSGILEESQLRLLGSKELLVFPARSLSAILTTLLWLVLRNSVRLLYWNHLFKGATGWDRKQETCLEFYKDIPWKRSWESMLMSQNSGLKSTWLLLKFVFFFLELIPSLLFSQQQIIVYLYPETDESCSHYPTLPL